EEGIRAKLVTGVQTCALPIWRVRAELERELLHARDARDRLAHVGRAREADLAHARVGAEERAEQRAGAGDALERERRQAGLEQEIGRASCRKRGGEGGGAGGE